MRRFAPALLLALVVAIALAPATAQAEFGLEDLDLSITDESGSAAMQAGSHPFAVGLSSSVFTEEDPESGFQVPGEEAKNIVVSFPPGLAGSPTAVPRCSTADFLSGPFQVGETPHCPDASALGVAHIEYGSQGATQTADAPVFNLQAPPGSAARLGFVVESFVVVVVEGRLNPNPPYNLIGTAANISQTLFYLSSDITLWGVPADPLHDKERGSCLSISKEGQSCPVSVPQKPFLTLPTRCEGPLITKLDADSWQHPGAWLSYQLETHDDSEPTNPLGTTGCSKLDFKPQITAQPTARAVESPSGFDFSIDVDDEGITNSEGLADSQIKQAIVTLPEGLTVNPAVAEGLQTCTPAQYGRERPDSEPGEGCPEGSKIGTLEAESPLLEDTVFSGSVYLAQQDDEATTTPGAENPFDSLLAMYFVVKDRDLGVMVKLASKISPDPKTGQLTVTTAQVPQLPLSHFKLHLREGARSPLATPPACGSYEVKATFIPWANPAKPLNTSASFEVLTGIGGSACPPGGIPPFAPDFEAGAINNDAGSFSPFNMRLIRGDGEQDMTKFSSVLPPGELGSLAGVDKCPDQAIAIARSKTGRQELASSSCPPNSLIGHTRAGAGVGGALTYVPGKIYLGGPYHGKPLSVISITPALAGPFDAGTVVVQLALDLNPKTAEVEVDGAASDPIPHILKGLVLKVRDLRVYVDRKNFTLNPTSCDPSSARARIFGSYLDVISPADDVPVDLATRYQAANCLNLGFKPKLNLNLKGGTKRGGHPGLKALYKPRKGDANVKGLVVRLPQSAFLDQAHIRTICTRVQFAADACPKAAQYGYIKAWTPLLDEPLQGPVWLRSSNHKLPDLVFDLHGLVDVEVATRIDSARGGIRATVEDAPDAPLSKVELRMQGAKKGLIVNSRNLCDSTSRANVQFSGHNGKQLKANPVMRADGCGGKRRAKRR